MRSVSSMLAGTSEAGSSPGNVGETSTSHGQRTAHS